MFTCIVQRVVVAELGVIVITRIGVTTLTVVQAKCDGVIVIALQRDHSMFAQYIDRFVRVRTESSKVSQAKDMFNATGIDIVERGIEREIIAIDTAE